MKVICAGYPKSGTKTVTEALRILGYDKVYDYPEAVEFGFDEWEKILNNESSDIDEVLDKVYANGVEAVVDVPHCFFFEKFFRRWPDAKVLLTVRDENKQYESFRKMIDDVMKLKPILQCLMLISPTGRRFNRWSENLTNLVTVGMHASRIKWIELLRRQIAYVKEVVPEDQLLVYDVGEGWTPLCKFLGKPVPREEFPFHNKHGSENTIQNTMSEKSKIIRKVESEVKMGLFLSSVVLSLIVGLFIYYL